VWDVITALCDQDPRTKGVNLSRNFGQAAAVMAGFSKASGDYILTLDDDGQCHVGNLKGLIDKLESENYDIVYGINNKANFSFLRKLGSSFHTWVTNLLFDRPKERLTPLCIIKRFVVNEMLKYTFPYTYLVGLMLRTTRNIGYFEVEHRERIAGKSGYTFRKLVGLWLDGFVSFSIRPLRIAMLFGGVFSISGFIFGLIVIIRRLVDADISVGWSSVISVLLVASGLNFVILGLLGEYVGRSFMCINKTPQYVIKECVNILNSKENVHYEK